MQKRDNVSRTLLNKKRLVVCRKLAAGKLDAFFIEGRQNVILLRYKTATHNIAIATKLNK